MSYYEVINDELDALEMLLQHEKSYNVWTIRLTPRHETYTLSEKTLCKCEYIVEMFRSLKKTCPFFVVYAESKKKGGPIDHYHARIVHRKWGTPANLYRWIKKWFPNESGNTLFATKKVWVNGQSYSGLAKSLSYIAKERHLLQSRGYDKSVIELAESIGSQWPTNVSKEPKYKQIIEIYKLSEHTMAKGVVHSVLKFYEREGQPPPTYYQLTRILQLIKYTIDPSYRERYTKRAISSYQCNWDM